MRKSTLFLFLLFTAFKPVIMPNGTTLKYEMDGNVKVFHLVAEPIVQKFADGLEVNCWGYNGATPGPLIEAEEGDRVRIFVTNHLPESTTVHWHGLILPNGMDGVLGLTQPPIKPGETFVYEFDLVQSGTFMYHPHADEVVQLGMGLMGFFIIHPKTEEITVDRDYAIMAHEWFIPFGAKSVDPTVAVGNNYFTFNGKVFPATEPLLAKKGEKVRIRFGNVSINDHPMHLHGYNFTVTARGSKRIPSSAQYDEVTVNVIVGATVDIEFIANYLGDWALHCHKTHHLMNGMSHPKTNMIGVHLKPETIERIRKHLPNYMPMGSQGMEEMFTHRLNTDDYPTNFLPFGTPGPFGTIDMGGMFTIFKVREEIDENTASSWYCHPEGSVAHKVE